MSLIDVAIADHYTDLGGPSGFLKDDLNTFWSLARKFELPILLLAMVLLGWRHPITLAINIALFLLCTKPSPLSIYMFIEQVQSVPITYQIIFLSFAYHLITLYSKLNQLYYCTV